MHTSAAQPIRLFSLRSPPTIGAPRLANASEGGWWVVMVTRLGGRHLHEPCSLVTSDSAIVTTGSQLGGATRMDPPVAACGHRICLS